MAGRKYVPVTCFEGEKPYVKVKLTSMNGETFDIDLRIDTGFEGSILLDNSTYSKFRVGELPESLWPKFKTLNGYLVMRASRAILNVLDRQIETYVLTPRDFEGKNLVGLEVLKELAVLLRKNETCIMKEID